MNYLEFTMMKLKKRASAHAGSRTSGATAHAITVFNAVAQYTSSVSYL
jgi:hypothetical protein